MIYLKNISYGIFNMAFQLLKKYDFKKIISNFFYALFLPKKFFLTIGREGSLVETNFKTLMYGTLTAILSLPKLTYIYSSSFISLFFNRGMLIYITMFGMLFTAFILLFIDGLFLSAVSAPCNGIRDFNLSLKISALILILIPLNMLFGYLHFIHIYLSIFANIIIVFYGIWMFYNELIRTFDTVRRKVKITSVIIAIIVIYFAVFEFDNAYINPRKNLRENFIQSPIEQMLLQEPNKNIN